MDTIPTRRWYRLHWVTWIAMVVEFAAIARCQFIEQLVGIASSGSYVKESYFGSPAIDLKQIESGERHVFAASTAPPPTFKYTWYLRSLAFHCGFWALPECRTTDGF